MVYAKSQNFRIKKSLAALLHLITVSWPEMSMPFLSTYQMSPPSLAPPVQREVSFVSALIGSDKSINQAGTYDVMWSKILCRIYKSGTD